MKIGQIIDKKAMITFISIGILQGCSDSINERNRLEAERWANIWEEKPVEVEEESQTPPRRPIIPERTTEASSPVQNDIKDERIERLESRIAELTENHEGLKTELAELKENNSELKRIIDEKNAEPKMMQPAMSGSDFKGLHLASYKTMDNLKIGWMEYSNTGQKVIENKQPRIVRANVSGTEYLRLVVGPYADANEARNACEIMKQTISFCNIVDFTGEALE